MAAKIFFSYAHEDESLLHKLKKHLSPLEREGLIEMWYDREINAGAEWEQKIKIYLNTADIILLLISPDFMASKYCNSVEVKRAMERHEAEEASVIPIILRPTYWQKAPFGKLQALPKDGKPVISWKNQDKALLNIVEGIEKAIGERIKQTPTSVPRAQQTHPVLEQKDNRSASPGC